MSAQTAEQLRDLLQDVAGNTASNSQGTIETMGEAIKHNVPLPEDAADILKTIGKLKSASSSFLSLSSFPQLTLAFCSSLSSLPSLYLCNLSPRPLPLPIPDPSPSISPPLPPHRNLPNPLLSRPIPPLSLLLRPPFPHRSRTNLILDPERPHAAMGIPRNCHFHRMFGGSCCWIVDGRYDEIRD